MFALKKLISTVLQPCSALLILMAVGMVLVCFSKRHRAGKRLLLAGLVGLFLSSLLPVANALVRPLEAAYRPLLPHALGPQTMLADGTAAPGWIVILGGGNVEAPALPPLQQLSPASASRLGEALRLHRLFPEAKLLLSGGTVHSRTLASAAQSLGEPRDRMELVPDVLDTEDEARAAHALLGQQRFVLVTSATHMPRAMALFRKAGMNPIPAPADYLGDNEPWSARHLLNLFPHACAAVLVERALHEYLGLVWTKLRGQA